jgi:membrane-associated protease RseP (regulator of RpoE activity)
MEEQRSKRFLKVGALLLALGLVMAWGMVVGGGLVYAWTHFFEGRERQAHVAATTWEEPRALEPGELLSLGALVVAVVPDSPADRAGLQEGDRILAIDGRRVGLEWDLAELIRRYEPGDQVTLKVDRPEEDSLEMSVRLAERPEQKGRAYLGVEYRPGLEFRSHGLRIAPFGESEGSFQFLVPGEEFDFNLDEFPGEFRFHVVPGRGESF